MGQLIEGVWHDDWYDTTITNGKFIRSTAKFRNWITPDGATGPTGDAGFKAESGRYHLYVSYACPWAHRTLIFRALKDLEEHITISAVHPDMMSDGWTFETDANGATGDTLYGLPFVRDIYLKADPMVSGRVTVPILWDKDRETIVSNESAEIIRMFNSAFDVITGNELNFWPDHLHDEIEKVNTRVYDTINNGVYKVGFATSQSAYDMAIGPLFESLNWLEILLSKKRYLMGNQLTEADWRLFTTLIRFDHVYHLHFKCNRARIIDYPNLSAYVRDLYQHPGVEGTVNLQHIVRHYHYSHETINPHRIIPINPDINFNAPHNRDHLQAG